MNWNLKRLFRRHFQKKQLSVFASWLHQTQYDQSQALIANPFYQIQVGYKSIEWVFRCIDIRATASSRIKLKLYQRKADGELEEVENHPVLQKFKKPNDIMTSWQEMRYGFNSYRLITGNGYILKGEAGYVSGNPTGLYLLKSQNVKPRLVDNDQLPVIYEVTMPDGSMMKVPMDRMIHWMNFNPDSHILGLSPIEVMRRTAAKYNSASKWHEHLLENDAKPPGMLSVPAILSVPERKELQRAMADQFQGHKNAGKPFIAEGDMKWIPLSMSPHDMDWLNLTKLNKEVIATTFGVPIQLLNSQESSTFANFEQARKSLYIDTSIPDAEKEAELYTHSFFPDGNFVWKVDMDSIEEIQENQTELWNRVNMSWELTPNEKRKLKGLAPLDDPAMDQIYIPNNFMPVDFIGGGEEE